MTVPPNTPEAPPASPAAAVAPEPPRQLDRRYISGCVAGLLLGGALGVPGAYALLRAGAEARPCAPGPSPARTQTLEAGLRALAQREPARALDIFLELRRAAPGDAIVHNNICVALNELGRYREAEAACRDALALDPGYARARNNLAWAQTHRDEPGVRAASSR